jgi:pantetheine-phosphate adenylyltransferase
LFSIEERIELLEGVCAAMSNVRIAYLRGLLVDFARKVEAQAIVRGLRAVSDFEFEFQMALMNRKMEPAIETIFLMPKEDYSYLSSRIVKEISRLGGRVAEFVPPTVETALKRKWEQGLTD